MISVSLCMIVKNEEDVLARCLDSAAGLVDEIIVVDPGNCRPLYQPYHLLPLAGRFFRRPE